MKKLLVIFAVCLTVGAFSSCKKTCTCVNSIDGVALDSITMESRVCADLNTSSTTAGVTQEMDCH